MYILSFEELIESINQIIYTIESNEALFGGTVAEAAYLLRDELQAVIDE